MFENICEKKRFNDSSGRRESCALQVGEDDAVATL